MSRILKVSTLGIVVTALLVPSAVFANPPAVTKLSEPITSNKVESSEARSLARSELISAWFECERFYQLPDSFTNQSEVEVRTSTEKNTGNNSTYTVTLMRFSHSAGRFMPEKSETNLVNGGAGWFFTGLDKNTLYTIQIDGNVKGHVSVYSVD